MTATQVFEDNYIRLGQIYQIFKNNTDSKDRKIFKLEAILESGFNVNYQLPADSLVCQYKPQYSGNTALHFAVEFHSNSNAACLDLLIKRGADFTIKNFAGYTPLLLGATSKSLAIDSLLFAHLDKNDSGNYRCNSGLSHFHVACTTNHTKVADFFLKTGAFVNDRIGDSSSFHGYAALHFAARHRRACMIEFLVSRGADLNVKDANGMTPLQLLLQRLMSKDVMKSDNEMQSLLEKAVRDNLFDLPDEANFTRLHLACFLRDYNSIGDVLARDLDVDAAIKIDSPIYPGYTPLHLALHFDVQAAEFLLKRGADLLARDSNGRTVLDASLEQFHPDDVMNILAVEKRHQLSALKLTDGSNLLDVLQGFRKLNEIDQFFQRTINNVDASIPLNSLIWPGYNLLHLAVMFFYYDEFMSRLLSLNANFTRINGHRMTPLHLAFRLKRIEAAVMILNAQRYVLANPVDEDNLSHLHVACAAQNVEVAKILLHNGADPNLPTLRDISDGFSFKNEIVKAGSTPLRTAVNRMDYNLVDVLLRFGANPNLADSIGVTPFQATVDLFNSSDKKDKDKINRVLELMLNSGLKISAVETMRNVLLLDHKSSLNDWLIRKFDRDNLYSELGLTRLQVACALGNFTIVREELNSGADVNKRVDFDSELWPGDTALHILLRKKYRVSSELGDLLLANGVDLTLKNADDETCVHVSKDGQLLGFTKGTTAFSAEKLLQNKFGKVNPVNNEGLSHFHLCCMTGNTLVIGEFLKTEINVNTAVDYFADFYAGYTPLHFAVQYGETKVVELLLSHGADPCIQAANGLSALQLGAFIGVKSLQNVEALLRCSTVRIHNTSAFGESALCILLENSSLGSYMIDTLLEKGAYVDFRKLLDEKSNKLNLLIEAAQKLSCRSFRLLIHNMPNLTSSDDKGRNAIQLISLRKNVTNSKYYGYIVETLVQCGCEVDHKDNKGETVLHKVTRLQDYKAVGELLSLGADVNIKDDNGKTPYSNMSNENTPDARHLRLTFIEHLHKLQESGLYIDKSNNVDFNNCGVHFTRKRNHIKKEKRILYDVLKQKVSSIFSVDYLFSEKFILNYRKLPVTDRQAIHNLCHSDNFYQTFLNLGPLIKLQDKKARMRTRLLEPAAFSFQAISHFSFPHLCLESIIAYLSNDDLMNVIRAGNEKLELSILPRHC